MKKYTPLQKVLFTINCILVGAMIGYLTWYFQELNREVKIMQSEEQANYPIKHELAIVIRGFADGASDPRTKAVYNNEANQLEKTTFTTTQK